MAYAELEAKQAVEADESALANAESPAAPRTSSNGEMNAIPQSGRARPSASARMPAEQASEGEVSQSIPKTKGPKPWQGEVLTVNTEARANSLILANTSAKEVADGLVASMNFAASSNTPLEQLALVVRLPKTSDARILNLEPSDPSNYEGTQKRIAENGKFAIFMGTMKNASAVSFNLALSGPETVDVRGSCGITPFMMKVDSSGTSLLDYPTR